MSDRVYEQIMSETSASMRESYARRAGQIRDVIRYIERFRGALVVIHIDDGIIASSLFTRHIRDISLLHKAGLRTVIVPAARRRISEVLAKAGMQWKMVHGLRVTSEEAMPLIKMAAFDAAAPVMTALSADRLTAVIGNWVRARGKGVVGTEDYITAGNVERIDKDAVASVLDCGFIPIFPCIGWSTAGRPYNISSVALSCEVAISLKAQKLFFLTNGARITSEHFTIPSILGQTDIAGGIARIAAMNTQELDAFISANSVAPPAANGNMDASTADTNGIVDNTHTSVLSLLQVAKDACIRGVGRVHILDGLVDGALPCEVFSDLGSGTMVYSTGYGTIRALIPDDIPAVLSLMRPFVESGRLLPRTGRDILERAEDYIVYELDGGVRACAALHIYSATDAPSTQANQLNAANASNVAGTPNTTPSASIQAEIAAVAVDSTLSHLGIGPMLIKCLTDRAHKAGADSIFILTTQAADWFEQLGFAADTIDSIPPSRRAKWSPSRGSKVYRLFLSPKANPVR